MPDPDSAYHLSRALYRRLAPLVGEEGLESATLDRDRVRVLDACEHTVKRLVEEPDFARPARFLFEEIRVCFPLSAQPTVRRVIDVYIPLARPWVERLRRLDERRCAARNREGMPCAREARPGGAYCPSHAPPADGLGYAVAKRFS